MKTIQWVLVVLIALAIVGLGGQPALAANEGGSSPALAQYIDNQPHTIAARTTQYYRFEYTGDNSPIQVVLLNGAKGPVAFNVFTPEQINETTWWLFPPIGRGTAPGCGEQDRSDTDKNCRPNANDLLWVGKFYAPGTYYVEVQNFSDQPQTFTLTIRGESVRLCAPSTLPCPTMLLIPNQ